MRKSTVYTLISLFLTIILVVALLSQINFSDIISVISAIKPVFILLGLSLYICSYFFRALRFNILLNDTVNLSQLFPVVCVHNIANQVLPARTGELSYIYLLKARHQKAVGEGMASLVVARVFDIIALASLFIISVVFIENLPGFVHIVVLLIVVIIVFLLIALAGVILRGNQFVEGTRSFLTRFGVSNLKVMEYLLRKADETADSFDKMRSKKQMTITFVISTLLWGSHCSMLYILAIGMNIVFPVHLMVFAITFYLLTTFLPISTIGGFGIKEAGWTLAFSIIGVQKELAISSGFGFHIIVLTYSVLLGLCGFLLMNKNILRFNIREKERI